MPGAEGGLGATPVGHRPRTRRTVPRVQQRATSALQRWSPGTGVTERQQPDIGVPASPGELHPPRFLTGCIPSNPALAGGCSPAPSLLVTHSPLLGSPER